MSQQKHDFSDLSALFINCTLKKSPQQSHTEGLMKVSKLIMEKQGVKTEILRFADYEVALGVQPDMTEHGADKDDWPMLFKKVMAADILIVGTPIWLGDKSSVCTHLIERLYSNSGQTNDAGQYVYYGKTGGTIITGNEDGVKHCAMNILYSLQHIGYTVPPQADAGWIGAVGPGPSYLDENSGGPNSDFTNRNTTFMTWNLLHTARILKDLGGFPAYGNIKTEWNDGERFDFEQLNPEYR